MKDLSSDNRAMWLQAGNEFTALSLKSEIYEVIKWAPCLSRSGENYCVPRKSIPENVWEAMYEIEEWGMAEKLDTPDGELFRVDASLFDLIMMTIKLLLNILRQPQNSSVMKETLRLTYDSHPTLG